MAVIKIKGNLKLISTGNVPTTSNLPKGYCAFGTVDGKASLYGNIDGTEVVDLFKDITIEPVQTLGQSTTAIMSQKAVTDALTSLGHLFTLKGVVSDLTDLPTTDNKQGDVYIVVTDATATDAEEYVWTGTKWERLGVVVKTDLSAYYTKDEIDTELADIRANAITTAERQKLNTIVTDGDGTKVLTNDGIYSNIVFEVDEI